MKANLKPLSSYRLVRWQDSLTRKKEKLVWKKNNGFRDLVLEQHLCNKTLWHLEDHARRKDLADCILVQIKRKIDTTNQKRNDSIEEIDRFFLSFFSQQGKNKKGELHSESLGTIIDRLSILSLKIYHMKKETERKETSQQYRSGKRKQWQLLKEQRNDLAFCFDKLLCDIWEGKKRMKVYYQFKLYNNPESNPALYGKEKLKL